LILPTVIAVSINKAESSHSKRVKVFISYSHHDESWLKEALDNRAKPRDNSSVIAGGDWVHGRQAAWSPLRGRLRLR
jgi:hypothetical protein